MASTLGVPEPMDEVERLKKEIQHLTELHKREIQQVTELYNTSARRNEELNDFLEDLKAFVRCGICEKLPRTVFDIDGKCVRCSRIVCRDCSGAECIESKPHQTSRREERPPVTDRLTMKSANGKIYNVLETEDALLRPCSQNISLYCAYCQRLGYSYIVSGYQLILGICKFCQRNVCKRCEYTICKEIGLPHNHNRTITTKAEMKLMNQILSVSFHSCKWTEAGCKANLKLKPLQLHELDCEFRDVRCPNDDCAKMVPFAELLDHFLECSGTTLYDKLSLKDCIEVSVGTNKENGKDVINVWGPKVIPVKFKEHLLFIKVGTRTRGDSQLFQMYVVMNTFEGSNKYRVKVMVSYEENAVIQALKILPTSSDPKDKCTCIPWDQNTPPNQKCEQKCSEVQKAFDSRPRSIFVQYLDQLAQLCNDDEMSGDRKKLSVQLNVFEY